MKYKLVFRFILTFLLVYVSCSLLYELYLKHSDASVYYPDYITNLVAKQTKGVLNVLGYKTEFITNTTEPSLTLVMNSKYIVRIVEGCNAVSVIVLFMSFIIAFSGKLKTTVFYILFGSVLIYVTNLSRIALLCVWIYHSSKYLVFLHDVLFPLVIYGLVFILWIFWVNYFAKLKR